MIRYLSDISLAPGVLNLIGSGVLVSKISTGDSVTEPAIRSASDFSYSAEQYAGNGYRIAGDAGGEFVPFYPLLRLLIDVLIGKHSLTHFSHLACTSHSLQHFLPPLRFVRLYVAIARSKRRQTGTRRGCPPVTLGLNFILRILFLLKLLYPGFKLSFLVHTSKFGHNATTSFPTSMRTTTIEHFHSSDLVRHFFLSRLTY